MKIKGFNLFLGAVFLNAFIDLGHKITVQNTLFKLYDGADQVFHTAIVNSLILWPYIFLFSVSSYISDRHPRHSVMRATAIMSIVATMLITLCYWLGEFWWAYGLTLFMAAQSAIYGPAKYGYIRDLLGRANVARGNGAAHALTIMSILGATVLFSAGFEFFYLQSYTTPQSIIAAMVPIGFMLIALAVLEAWFVWQLPAKTEPNKVSFNWRSWISLTTFKENLQPVASNPVLWGAILGLTTFWCVGQIALAAWPAHMKAVTGQTNTLWVQAVMGASGLGIGIGAFIGGRISKNYIEWGGAPIGVIVAIAMIWLLPNLTNPSYMAIAFLLFGIAGGLFIVPLNSLLQFNAADHQVGRVLAGNNWVQNVAMVSCLMIAAGASVMALPPKFVLLFSAALMTVMGVLTVIRFKPMRARWGDRRHWLTRLQVQGLDCVPQAGVIIQTDSPDDFRKIQMATPRTLYDAGDHTHDLQALVDQGEAVITATKGRLKGTLVIAYVTKLADNRYTISFTPSV